eukprot:3021475-Amphidinium_carterae.1
MSAQVVPGSCAWMTPTGESSGFCGSQAMEASVLRHPHLIPVKVLKLFSSKDYPRTRQRSSTSENGWWCFKPAQ